MYVKFMLGDYSVQVIDQDDDQMRTDPYADFEAYQHKQHERLDAAQKKRQVLTDPPNQSADD